MIRELAYADDLFSGVTAQEVADLQDEFWSSMNWTELRKPCGDRVCCPTTPSMRTTTTALTAAATPTTTSASKTPSTTRAATTTSSKATPTTGPKKVMARWQGGRMSRHGRELLPPHGETQYNLLPPPANGVKYKQAAANPEDEELLC